MSKGANHGWMPPDSQNHNAEAAERGWARKLALFRFEVGDRNTAFGMRTDDVFDAPSVAFTAARDYKPRGPGRALVTSIESIS